MPRAATFRDFDPIAVGPDARVFVLTGAGISAESGIPTFRDANGLWEQHRVEDVATPEGFDRDPALVWRFYSERRRQAAGCLPNAAHLALARFGEALGDRLFLCTQNVDPLHERAGSRGVLHMHGELSSTRCEGCDRPAFHDEALYLEATPRCGCGARLPPALVWFSPVPLHLPRIFAALSACDVFVTIGSSGAVHPAAGFVTHVRNEPSIPPPPHAPPLSAGPGAARDTY